MATSKILPNYTSDHKPILLELSLDGNLEPIPFRFISLWIHQEGFQEVVSEAWNRKVHEGSPFFVWEEKMRRLKRELKECTKRLKMPIAKRKEMHDSLAGHQLTMENSDVTQILLQKEVELQKYLHRASIKRATHSFFKDLYSALEDPPIDSQAYSIDLIPHCVQDSDNIMLAATISKNEIKEALDCMDPDKALGPDGFTARFYLTCRPTIKKDLLRMIRKSQTCTKIGGSTNSAFLALILKDKGATDFNRFMPISFCNTSYKLITKIIANCIKEIMSVIIPKNQGGFIKGRKILDNIVLVQEAIHSSCHRKEKGMVIKLDLTNAFDRVRHDFLFSVMEKFGFSKVLITWVKACIASPWIAPLVNGRSTEFFQASRGLRQGCPLSLLLYAIQALVLSFQLDYCQ
eukprot:PITA_24211